MNQVTLIGRLVKEPELVNAGDKQKLDFTLAVNTKVKGKADFISCTAWGKTAEIMTKYLNKGSQVCVYGEIKNNNYEDSKGVKHYGMKVQVNSIEFIGSKGETQEEEETVEKSIPSQAAKQSASPYDYMPKEEVKPSPFENVSNHNGIIDDDLPF
jgi:single-strand DNA-binding protein